MSTPGEYNEGRETENIELKECQRQEQEEANEQYDTPNRFEDAYKQDPEQSKTNFGGDKLGGTSQENRDSEQIGNARNRESDEFKEKELRKYFDIPMKKDMNSDFFRKTKFIPRKSGLSTGRISYNGKDILYIQKGEARVLSGMENEAQDFYLETRDTQANIRNENMIRGIIVDRGLTIGEIDRFDAYFSEAGLMYKNRQGQINKVGELDEIVKNLDTKGDERLAQKARQVADKICTELLAEDPRYEEPEAIGDRFRDRVIQGFKKVKNQLDRVKEWLRSRFPLIAGLVAFTAGVFSIIFAVVKLTKNSVATAAKGAHKAGKTTARILAKLGPIAAAIGSFILSLMSFLALGIMWIANNLWILLVAVIGYLYNEYGRRRK